MFKIPNFNLEKICLFLGFSDPLQNLNKYYIPVHDNYIQQVLGLVYE